MRRGIRIALTRPDFFAGEAQRIASLLRGGMFDLVHLRKPEATEDDLCRLIGDIPEDCRGRLVLHDGHQLCARYGLHGIHLNRRHPVPPAGHTGSISRSCHTLDEVVRWKPACNYVLLSPVFDSISKADYHSGFTEDELMAASRQGIIDCKVIALGGVTEERMAQVLRWGFGGGAMLGAVWNEKQPY